MKIEAHNRNMYCTASPKFMIEALKKLIRGIPNQLSIATGGGGGTVVAWNNYPCSAHKDNM